MSNEKEAKPGEGIRSLKTSNLFRAINFELYVRPNLAIMGLGLIAITGCAGYIAYMRYTYEKAGYYSVVNEDGTESFQKKRSKWD
ncbi:small integral membrane protein 8 [Aethina tumida]|uniref:small integral membrane protein 8 n=1 Tax=Aethina tumida TaxID=116153 RepID=UPI00096B5C70|nr:small integral membrane protein 8 [Aethina tumida]